MIRLMFGPYLDGLGLFTSAKTLPSEAPEDVFVPYGQNAETGEPVTAETRDEIDGNDIHYPRRGELYARIEFPTLNISENLYFDDSNACLAKGVGQYYGTHIVGYGTPVLICGHNNTFFNNLQYLNVGDDVVITTTYGIYRYRITETAVHTDSDPGAFDLRQDREQLILYTCYPFTALGLTHNRYYVYADKISGPYVRH